MPSQQPRTGDDARPPPSAAPSPPFAEPFSFAPRERRLADEVADLPRARPDDTAAMAERVAPPANDQRADPDPRMRALIVIPTLNEAKVVARIIARVLDDDDLVDPLLVVADGGSTDRTREIVREIARRDPRVRLVDNPGRLQSAGLNLAVAAVAGDRPWLVRVDAHADYPRNYASTLIAEALRTGATAVVVSMDTVGAGGFQSAVAAAQNSLIGSGGSAHRTAPEGRWVDHGHHALCDMKAFQALGGYDETFSHNEDAEFDLRLARQGGAIWLTEKARIAYYPRSTPGTLFAQYFSYGRGRARTVLKHDTPLKLRQALPLAVAPALAGAALAPLSWLLALPVLVWALAALAFGLALGVRKRDAHALFSGPAAMIMHLAWSAGFWVQLVTNGAERRLREVLSPPRITVS